MLDYTNGADKPNRDERGTIGKATTSGAGWKFNPCSTMSSDYRNRERLLKHWNRMVLKANFSTSSFMKDSIDEDLSETEEDVDAVHVHFYDSLSEIMTTTETTTNSKNSTKTTAKKMKKTVQWSNLDIHYHGLCLGDNPSVTDGPPIALSWNCVSSVHELPIDEYEQRRQESRRGHNDLRVPRMTREDWLKDEGYSRSEIREASVQARKDMMQRQKSAKSFTDIILKKLSSHKLHIPAMPKITMSTQA